jgi:hypothetical protein
VTGASSTAFRDADVRETVERVAPRFYFTRSKEKTGKLLGGALIFAWQIL